MTDVSDTHLGAVGPALTRMAEFLETMTLDMSAVASIVSDLTTTGQVVLTDDQVTQLQSIDRMYQALQDLSVISELLAQGPVTSPDQNPGLQLADTRAILDPVAASVPSSDCGMLDLF